MASEFVTTTHGLFDNSMAHMNQTSFIDCCNKPEQKIQTSGALAWHTYCAQLSAPVRMAAYARSDRLNPSRSRLICSPFKYSCFFDLFNPLPRPLISGSGANSIRPLMSPA